MRMYFTLAVSAATREACAALAGAAERTYPRVMPITGPARVAWRGAVVVSDRASWAAAVTGRLGDPDPAMAAPFSASATRSATRRRSASAPSAATGSRA